MAYRISLRLKLNGAKWINGYVEKSWEEFRSEVMETAEGVCGQKKCRNDKELDGGIKR